MAVDFEISSLSGTGTATIRVKPKAVNTEQTLKEQVLKVVVQGVEREVTLVQKAAPKIVETWGTYFSITPETTSHTFDGTKRGDLCLGGQPRAGRCHECPHAGHPCCGGHAHHHAPAQGGRGKSPRR